VYEAVIGAQFFGNKKLLLTTFHFLLTDRTLEEKYELNLPPYPGFAQIVELPQQDEESSQKL
jgi:hypothetical protein